MFKVGNLRKEMVFRAKNTEDRDDWMNRFSLGQIKNRFSATNAQCHMCVVHFHPEDCLCGRAHVHVCARTDWTVCCTYAEN